MPALVWGPREPLCCNPLLHVFQSLCHTSKATDDITRYIGLLIYLEG
jgi:hypothetical protein